MRVVWSLAVRYLVARFRQSLLTIGGIVLGVLALTVIQGMMGGFKQTFVEKTLGTSPHIMVRRKPLTPKDPTSPTRDALQTLQDPLRDRLLVEVPRPPLPEEEDAIRNPSTVQETIRQVPGVAATAPLVTGQVMFGLSGQWEPLTLNGIVPSEQSSVGSFAKNLKGGTAADLERNQGNVVLGRFLAERMRIHVGDRVVARAEDGSTVSLRVVALHDSLVYDVDNSSAWVNLSRAQALLDLGGSINAVQVRTRDFEQAFDVARRIEYALGMEAESWMEANANTLGLVTMMTTIMYLVTGFTMTVAGFGIAGNLITTVSEKTFDIGVLKAMGMSANRISAVFLVLAMLMMAIGVVLGLTLSYFVVETLARTPSAAKPQPGVLVASETMPMFRSWTIYAISGSFAMLISVVAGISPALRAARLEPLNIIRGSG